MVQSDEDVCRVLNGGNSLMVIKITVKSPHEEAIPQTHTFDLINSIRSRCLQWLGHILRMQPNLDGTERLVKSVFRHIFQNPKKGDLFMDTPMIRLHHGENYVCGLTTDDRDKGTHGGQEWGNCVI